MKEWGKGHKFVRDAGRPYGDNNGRVNRGAMNQYKSSRAVAGPACIHVVEGFGQAGRSSLRR